MKKQLELNTMEFFRAFGSILASCSVSFSHNARIAPSLNRTICSKLTSKSLESNL